MGLMYNTVMYFILICDMVTHANSAGSALFGIQVHLTPDAPIRPPAALLSVNADEQHEC